MTTSDEPPHGILNIAKPSGLSSHDVVQVVRRSAHVRRVGHAGTLDPLATGVLLVCLGAATRVIAELQAGAKRYRATVRLGVTTTTYDAEGETMATADASAVAASAIEAALAGFRGPLQQTPPMHSAVHHHGRRLYRLARQGIEVPRPPRAVTVHRLELVTWHPPDLTLDLTVSPGTYVRSIAHDLGQVLGVGGHLAALARTAVGGFGLPDAVSLDQVVRAFAEGWWPRLLHPLDRALVDYSAMVVDERDRRAIQHGQAFAGAPPPPTATRLVRAYDPDGRFLALVRWDDALARWLPERVFASAA